jgi:2-hydroxy-6-oxonona-2,4-dienedioate hydrolase
VVSYALRYPTLPGYGELLSGWGKTPPGAAQRAWLRVPLLFAHPERVPPEWFKEQYRLAQLPGFVEATVAALRAQVDLGGQREVLLDRLPRLEIPTLVVWGTSDRIFPISQARDAVARLRQGSLEIIPDCGHLPHVERPDLFVAALNRFLGQQTDH